MKFFRFKRDEPVEKPESNSVFDKLKGFIIDPSNDAALNLYIQLRLPKSWEISLPNQLDIESTMSNLGASVSEYSKKYNFDPLPESAQGYEELRALFKSGAIVLYEALESCGIDPKSRPIIGPCLLEVNPDEEKSFGNETFAAAQLAFRTIRLRSDSLDSISKNLPEDIDEHTRQALIATAIAHECGHACANIKMSIISGLSGRIDAKLISEGWCDVNRQDHGWLLEELSATWYQYKSAEREGLELGICSDLTRLEAIDVIDSEYAGAMWTTYNEMLPHLPENERKLCNSARQEAVDENDLRVPKVRYSSIGTSITGERVVLRLGYGDCYQAFKYMVEHAEQIPDCGLSVSTKDGKWRMFENALIAGHLNGQKSTLENWLKSNFGERIYNAMMTYPVNKPDAGWISLFGLTYTIEDKMVAEKFRDKLLDLFDKFLKAKIESSSNTTWGPSIFTPNLGKQESKIWPNSSGNKW